MEGERRRRKANRSAVIVSILDEWFAKQADQSRDEAYRAAYRAKPESEHGAVATLVIGQWEPWK